MESRGRQCGYCIAVMMNAVAALLAKEFPPPMKRSAPSCTNLPLAAPHISHLLVGTPATAILIDTSNLLAANIGEHTMNSHPCIPSRSPPPVLAGGRRPLNRRFSLT